MALFHNSEVSSTFVLTTVAILLVTVLWTKAAGQPRVIGSSQPVLAALGGDVILRCYVEPQLNVEDMMVQWWRPDVPPDPTDPLSDYKYVHMYKNNLDEEDMKMPSYAGRTALLKDGLKHGNVSLQIRNVKLSDEGRYRCQIPQLGSASVVKLDIDPNSVKTWTTLVPQHPRIILTPDPTDETDVKGEATTQLPEEEGSHLNQYQSLDLGGRHHLCALIPGLVAFILSVGFLVKLKCQRQNPPRYYIPPTKTLPD